MAALICEHCGTHLESTAKFCPECGSEVVEDAAPDATDLAAVWRAKPQPDPAETRGPAEPVRPPWGMNALTNFAHGPIHPQVVCPHCGERGPVHLKRTKQKKGVSGGKATAAIMTGGLSMLATGLSRKEKGMQAFCENCSVTWMV